MLNVDRINLFYGASRCLRSVSLAAMKGRITCLLGRNGVGKSSLLRAIMGLESVRDGRMTYDDRDITRLPTSERARIGIGYVPQGREIFPLLTVEENLQSGFGALPRDRRRIPDDVFATFPVLEGLMKRRGGDLSGGQQQQLAIARALVLRPRLLLLDEPTEGIQPSIIKEIELVIRRLRDGGEMAILLVEQYYDFARRLADHVAIMDRGEIVLSGPTAEISEDAARHRLTV